MSFAILYTMNEIGQTKRENKMITYNVTTEQGTYNSVNSVYHFIHTVRPNNLDWTEIQSVFEWVNGQGWQKVEPMDWVENHS